MAVRVGINGFGRIGRLVVRSAINDKDIEFVAVNDLVPADALGYLLKYDSTHGNYEGQISGATAGDWLNILIAKSDDNQDTPTSVLTAEQYVYRT